MDFTCFNLPWGGIYALLIVLGYSRLLWRRFYRCQSMEALFHGLEHAIAYFGGVPEGLA